MKSYWFSATLPLHYTHLWKKQVVSTRSSSFRKRFPILPCVNDENTFTIRVRSKHERWPNSGCMGRVDYFHLWCRVSRADREKRVIFQSWIQKMHGFRLLQMQNETLRKILSAERVVYNFSILEQLFGMWINALWKIWYPEYCGWVILFTL